jgi:hypothetical protein
MQGRRLERVAIGRISRDPFAPEIVVAIGAVAFARAELRQRGIVMREVGEHRAAVTGRTARLEKLERTVELDGLERVIITTQKRLPATVHRLKGPDLEARDRVGRVREAHLLEVGAGIRGLEQLHVGGNLAETRLRGRVQPRSARRRASRFSAGRPTAAAARAAPFNAGYGALGCTATGTRLSSPRPPLPSSPARLRPQHHTVAESSSAQLWLLAAATETKA